MIRTEADISSTTKPDHQLGTTTSTEHRYNVNNNNLKVSADASSSTIPTSSWTRLKDPRIVRVSRAFGGKDRHSKVCTVRGLRDRRVRLSVPTAIQLYDLQDRLGLNQPSKVVDWLLNAAKNEIEELPPLQLPPIGNFNPNLQQWLCSAASHYALNIKEGLPLEPSSMASLKCESKEVAEGDNHDDDDGNQDQNWTRKEEGKQQQQQQHQQHQHQQQQQQHQHQQQQQQGHDIDQNRDGGYHNPNNLFPRTHHNNHSPLPNLLNNAVPFNSFSRWDPSSLSLSHVGSTHHHQDHQDFHNFNVLPLPSPSGLPHSFFHNIGSGAEFIESRNQLINFQMLSSTQHQASSNNPQQLRPPPIHRDFTSHSLRPLHFLGSHNSGNESNKESNNDQFHSTS